MNRCHLLLFPLQVLQVVGKAINGNMPDAHDKPAGRLRTKFLELLGRVTAKVVIKYLYIKLTFP